MPRTIGDFKLFACRGGEIYAKEVANELNYLILKRKKELKLIKKERKLLRSEKIERDFIRQADEEDGIKVSLDEKISFADDEINVKLGQIREEKDIFGQKTRKVLEENVRDRDVYLIQNPYNKTSQIEITDLINNILEFSKGKIDYKNKSRNEVDKQIIKQTLEYVRRFGNGVMSVNDNILEAALHIRALKTAKAGRINLISHYFPYSRGDKQEAKEGITSRFMADLLVTAGIDHLVTTDLHASQIVGFFPPEVVEHLHTAPLFIHYIKNYLEQDINSKYKIMSPDTGGAKRANKIAKELSKKLIMAYKTRNHDKIHEVGNVKIIGKLTKSLILGVDDIITSGGTVKKLMDTMSKIYRDKVKNEKDQNFKNLKNVYMFATFPQLVKNAPELFEKMYHDKKNPFKLLIGTDMIPHNGDLLGKEWIKIINTSRYTAKAIYEMHVSGSVSKLHSANSVEKEGLWK